MRVIVLGAGQVGYSIARALSLEDNDVCMVDQSPEFLKRVGDSLDIQPIVGHASYPDVLEKAGAAQADLIVAVTGSDEVNIVACQVANALFQVKTKIARVRAQNYVSSASSDLFIEKNLSIDHIISPEVEIAKAIHRSLGVVGAFNVISLLDDSLKAVGLRCPAKAQLLNTPLRLLPSSFPHLNFCVLCITRGDKIFMPDGDDQLIPNDEIYLLVEANQLQDVTRALGLNQGEGTHVLIAGGGHIGLALAKNLQVSPHLTCKMIERNPLQAELAARTLLKTEVLCGDALDFNVLKEANVASTQTIVCVTNDDKVNVLAALLAKRQGAERAMTLLNNEAYGSFIASLGVDAIINPKSITVSTILQHIRQGRIRGMYAIRGDFAEIIDAEARETSLVVGMRVSDVAHRDHIMVAVLKRDNQMIFMPSPHTLIRINDRLIMIAKKVSIKKIEKLFSMRSGYA